jgi:hypothetical protein
VQHPLRCFPSGLASRTMSWDGVANLPCWTPPSASTAEAKMHVPLSPVAPCGGKKEAMPHTVQNEIEAEMRCGSSGEVVRPRSRIEGRV